MNNPILHPESAVGSITAASPIFYQVTKDGSGGWYFTDQRGAVYGPFADHGSAEHVYSELQAWYRSSGKTVRTS